MKNALLNLRSPSWSKWYLNYGLAGAETKVKRRQYIANVLGFWGASNCLFYAISYVVVDVNLWPGTIFALGLGVTLFLIPFVYVLGAAPGAIYSTISVSLWFVLSAFLFGSHSGAPIWILIVPCAVLLTVGPERPHLIIFSTAFCVASIIISGVFFPTPAVHAADDKMLQVINYSVSVILTTAMIVGSLFLVFLRAEKAENALEEAHARSEALLYNLLPKEIAVRLKLEPDKTIADSLPQVAILFADIVNFTPRAASLPPEKVVGFLNRIFSAFDGLAEKHGLEKIKTIGDAYMVAAGMPSPIGNPVHRIAEMALDMQRVARELSPTFPDGLQVRVGLHAGPAVAGVIGNKKLFYDVWGETVNTASRMESHGEPGRIQVTGPAYTELVNEYEFEKRGTVEVKGMGMVETWWLTGKATAA